MVVTRKAAAAASTSEQPVEEVLPDVEEPATEPEDVHVVQDEEAKLPLLYANNKEAVDVRDIAALRPFADLLRLEMGSPSLSFLGTHRITLKELENIVHQVIAKLETTRPLKKPATLPQPSAYEKAKYKIKDFKVSLKDIKHDKAYSKAIEVYKMETPARLNRKKSKLLSCLNSVAKKAAAKR